MPDPAPPAAQPSLEEIRKRREAEALALDCVRRIVALLKGLSTYPEGHAYAVNALEQARGVLDRLFEWKNPVTLHIEDNRLLIEEIVPDADDPSVARLREQMWKRTIRGIVLEKGIADADLKAFSDVLSMDPRELALAGGARAVLRERGGKYVRIAEFVYRMRKGRKVAEDGATYSVAELAGMDADALTRMEPVLQDPEVSALLREVAEREGLGSDEEDAVDIVPMLVEYVSDQMKARGTEDPAEAARILRETLSAIREGLGGRGAGPPAAAPAAPAPAAEPGEEGDRRPPPGASLLVGDIEVADAGAFEGAGFASFLQRYQAIRDEGAQKKIMGAIAGMEGVAAHLAQLRETMERNDFRDEYATVLFTIFRDDQSPKASSDALKKGLAVAAEALEKGEHPLVREILRPLLSVEVPEAKREVLRAGIEGLGLERLLLLALEGAPGEEAADAAFLRDLVRFSGAPALKILLDFYPLCPDAARAERALAPLLDHAAEALALLAARLARSEKLPDEGRRRFFRLVREAGGTAAIPCVERLLPTLAAEEEEEAYRLAARIGGEEGAGLLVRAVQREGRRMRLKILPLLADFDRPEVVNVLLDVAANRELLRRNYEERIQAIQALEKIGNAVAIPHLKRIAEGRGLFAFSDDRRVQTWAAFAASKIEEGERGGKKGEESEREEKSKI